jgi:malate/lactate dehydrogenase
LSNVIIWGNHSTTQYPSIEHATCDGQPFTLPDTDKFIERIQKRGAEVLNARGNSSVFSAANAVKGILLIE